MRGLVPANNKKLLFFFPQQKEPKSASVLALYFGMYMYIPKKLDFINAVLLLLWVIPIPKGTSYGRPEGLPLVAGLPTVAKELGFYPTGTLRRGQSPRYQK
ncbi:hypothetical protein BPP43_12130 [Brachyspira pilosicoli P43/6/78]|uniref:Uncharacterized protein n=1 Tax=Brachyspira pilosicoli P43/6/78 TaxID=1042417 RepID=A0A3B6VSH2_BRAPL|nr:hypothetical protein BPP43_12130 [Brachyspira pilosicoli P43/6/78]